MGDGYMCGRNVKMKESLSHFCGISFLPKWDFFFAAYSIYEATHTYAQNKTSISNISTFTITIYGLRLPKISYLCHITL